MKLKLLALALFWSLAIAAQNPGSISGKVIDSATKEAIPYVTVAIMENGNVVTGGLTEDNGTFTIKNIPLKQYTVEVQFMGYKTHSATVTLSEDSKTFSMGTITLQEDATQLDQVDVVREVSTIEQKIDRKVITLGKDLTTAGGTASEIMNNIPSVNVDQDGKISLRGNQNVRILIDGRPTTLDPAQLLKQIPSSSIKKIELITNPSAKYNPEGMSGIINIILHKNANDGFNGSFNSGITFGKTPKFNNSLDMNYRTGKVNFFGNVGSNFGKNANEGFVFRKDVLSRNTVDVLNDNEGVLGKIGMDYYINDNNTLSVYTNQNYFSGKGYFAVSTMYPEGSAFEDLYQYSDTEGDNHNNSYNLAFKHKFEKEGHTLDLEANYNDTQNTQDVVYDVTEGADTFSYSDSLEDNRENTTVNLDYVNPLSEKSTLELGAEARIIRSDNTYVTSNPNVDNPALRNSLYTYDMDIYSAYATFGQKFGKISYQVGARFESYKVAADFNNGDATFDDDYLTVYPSAYLTYSMNDNNMFQLSYSRRVDRPSLEQTKPVREFSTPQFTSLGNPELRPQFTNSIELNYTRMLGEGSSITGGVYYRLINDEISRIFYPDNTTESDQDQIMSYGNFDKNNAFGFEVSANYKIFKWWDIQPAIDYSSIRQSGVISTQSIGDDNFVLLNKTVDVNAFNARLNSNFRVNNRLSFNLFGFYRGPVNSIQNESKDMYKIDSGVRYTLLDNKMSLSVRFNDMFQMMRYGFESRNPFPQEGEFRWESRTVYFGLNYMFGSGKNKALQRKQRDDNTKQAGGGMF